MREEVATDGLFVASFWCSRAPRGCGMARPFARDGEGLLCWLVDLIHGCQFLYFFSRTESRGRLSTRRHAWDSAPARLSL